MLPASRRPGAVPASRRGVPDLNFSCPNVLLINWLNSSNLNQEVPVLLKTLVQMQSWKSKLYHNASVGRRRCLCTRFLRFLLLFLKRGFHSRVRRPLAGSIYAWWRPERRPCQQQSQQGSFAGHVAWGINKSLVVVLLQCMSALHRAELCSLSRLSGQHSFPFRIPPSLIAGHGCVHWARGGALNF